jgi:hypothetical protein
MTTAIEGEKRFNAALRAREKRIAELRANGMRSKAKPQAAAKPIISVVGERAEGPAGFLRRQAEQQPTEPPVPESFDQLAAAFWNSEPPPEQLAEPAAAEASPFDEFSAKFWAGQQ